MWIDCLIKAVSIMMVYVRAEREADRPLHLKAAYFFATGHVNYTRYGVCYLLSMERLPDTIFKRFMQGQQVM